MNISLCVTPIKSTSLMLNFQPQPQQSSLFLRGVRDTGVRLSITSSLVIRLYHDLIMMISPSKSCETTLSWFHYDDTTIGLWVNFIMISFFMVISPSNWWWCMKAVHHQHYHDRCRTSSESGWLVNEVGSRLEGGEVDPGGGWVATLFYH